MATPQPRSRRDLLAAHGTLSSRRDLISKRGGSNSWAQSERAIAAFRNGDTLAVPPVTMEYAPILACNANCPFCPFAATRHHTLTTSRIALGEVSPEDDVHSSTRRTAFHIIDTARAAGVRGVLFTGGGEPTIWRPLFDALAYCGQSGLHTAVYSNGFEIARQSDFALRLLHPDSALVFCRISINAASPTATRLHWGVNFSALDLQLEALTKLLHVRELLVPSYHARGVELPSLQVSTIVDKHTVQDVPAILTGVARVFSRYPKVRADDDTVVVRPLVIHGRRRYSTNDHSESVIQRIIAATAPEGFGAQALRNAGVRLFLGFGLDRIVRGEFASYSDLLAAEYASRRTSLANGLFLTVGPDGTAFPSTERNCDKNWALGSLQNESVAEIYRGARRREILARLDACNWGPDLSPPSPRTARLDRIADAIHRGDITDSMIAQIREFSLESHRLLLD